MGYPTGPNTLGDLLASLNSYTAPAMSTPGSYVPEMDSIDLPDYATPSYEAATSMTLPVGELAAGAGEPGLLSLRSFFGGKNVDGTQSQGWGGLALGGAQALMSGFMGMKQYGLMKQQLAEGKRQFNLNYGAQRQTINTQLEDRQRARVAANAGAYQSVGDYMNQNRVK